MQYIPLSGHYNFRGGNVSFAYPGGKSKDNAFKNLTLEIPAGSLVVIVGVNGSGKSTVIQLLNRLHDVDLGEILVDGLPIKNYRMVQALLTQDQKLYPLTLAENIGLGNPDRVNDIEMPAVRIKKLNDGVNTVLARVNTASGSPLKKDKRKKLQSILESLERKADVSGKLYLVPCPGGQKQRLVATRIFLRFLSGDIQFAVADGPNSALDPKGEHQLFQRLRKAREGMTLIFHADLIMGEHRCMKDGQGAESGTYKELMERRGEYSELYNGQAQAFADTPERQSTTPRQ
ncbi:P-loop containing nucleoside triphosphate hydrolase protein [Mycena vulgaris]|nr:P-loop containing nucleoside triphosphate hydrolase protein [Mycena vulgaris]